MDEQNNLPCGWVRTQLGDVIGSVKGKKPKNLGEQSDSLKIPYVTIEGFEKKIFNQFTDGKDCSLCEPSDVLIVWDGARCGLVGRGVAGAIGSTLAKLICGESSPHYLFYFLTTKYETINKRPKGVGIPHIDPNIFWTIPFPIAPLPEQHRIVAKIEELFSDLDAGVAALKNAKAQLKRYRQAVLKAAVEGKLTAEWRAAHRGESEPASALLERIRSERAKNASGRAKALPRVDAAELGALPEGWEWTRVAEVAEVRLGRQRSPKRASGPNMRKYVRAANATWSGLDLSDVKEMDFSPSEFEIYRLRRGDVLLGEASGSISEVGKPVIWNDQIPDCCFQNTLIRVRSCAPLPTYLYLHFFYDASAERFRKIAKGVGIHHLGAENLSNWVITLPTLAEQEQIVAEVERRLSVADENEKIVDASLKQAERLRQSILKRAFAGKLVPQDPSDEPAERLLERIKANQVTVKPPVKRRVAYVR